MATESGKRGAAPADPRRSRVVLAILIAVGLTIATLVVVAVFVVGKDEEILVLPQRGAELESVETGDGVQVNGAVARFADAPKPPEAEELAEFLGRNVIVARSVKVLDSPPPRITGGDPDDVFREQGNDLIGEEVTVLAVVAEDGLPGDSFTIERSAGSD